MASCNLHTLGSKTGMSLIIHKIDISQYVLLLPVNKLKNPPGQKESCWLEAGSFRAGPVISDILLNEGLQQPSQQREFLKKHDDKSRRLWFLWKNNKSRYTLSSDCAKRCGCVGGCNFFGKNVNGPIFFKTDRLDAAQEEQKNGLFRSPDGWQSMELEEDDNNSFFYHESHSKRLQRHNSWSGSGHSPKIQRDYFQGSARFSSTKGKM